MSESLTEPAKLLLLSALLTNDSIISNNGKAFLKEMILRRDTRAAVLLKRFEVQNSGDSSFLESLHDLIMNEAQSLYNELFFDTSLEVGKTLSKAERDTKCLTNEKSLIYGEVEFNSFYRVLRKINPAPGKVFYDLGSGTGKAVFAARFAYDFSKCVGIEILHGLHVQAVKVLERYNAEFKGQLAMGQSQHAAVYEGSFLDFDWSDGEVVFANSTCFDDALMLSLSQTAERLAPGAIVVTFTKGLSSPAFELLERKRYKMSWGPATVFIQRRLHRDGRSLGPANLNLLPSDDVTYDEDLRNQSIDDIDIGGGSSGNSGNGGGHGHTAHDYSSKDSEEEEEDDEGDDESEDDEDEAGDYGDDIDMYIKQGFDMDPNNEEEEEEDDDDEDEDYEEDEGEEDSNNNSESDSNDNDEEDEEGEDEDGNDSEDTDNNHQTTTHNYNNNNNLMNSNSSNSTGYHYTHQQEGNRPGSAPSSQQQHARQAAAASHASSGDDSADERMKVLMDKMAERRKVINDLINGPGSPIAAAAAKRDATSTSNSSHNSSASPASIPRNNTAATPPSAGRGSRSVGIAHNNQPATSAFTPPHSPNNNGIAHNNQPATSAFTPPHSPNNNGTANSDVKASRTPPTHNHANNFGHTITVEAPLSASRGNLTMLNPNLMRSPGASIPLNLSTSSLNSAAGADSPGNVNNSNVQIHSPLDSALLNRKRATAVGKRVPLSAFPSPFREDF